MKSLMSLWSVTAEEFAVRCCTSATRDITTVVRRTENEGLWFLAVTLSDFGKAIEKWLDQGSVGPQSDVQSFRFDRRTGLPRFLGGFLRLIFDPASGSLLDEPDIEAIIAVRQLTLMFSKIALPGDPSGSSSQVVTPERESKAMLEYVKCEQEVRESDARLTEAEKDQFCKMSDLLFASLFSRMDSDVAYGRLVPKHGPGAVAERLTSNGKYSFTSWTARLDKVFPLGDYLIPNYRFTDDLDRVDLLEPGAEIPVRVITVPKTLKTPRIIAIEPACMQYMQQALLRSFRSSLEQDDFLNRVIGLDDQEPNRLLARLGSLNGSEATLDLSEASDRVSYEHVRLMLRNHPHLLEAIDATRSRKARVPGHGVIRLAKYASMGSALCFPFEAMVFLTLIFLGIQDELNEPLSRGKLIKLFRGRVRVFGDDLIVPSDTVLSVVRRLEAFGARVNTSKSFWTGRFRESCGREYFMGQDVSIVKVRQVFPTRRQDATGVISVVSLRNQLYRAGLWQATRYLDNYIRDLIRHFPNVAPTSPVLGRECFLGYEVQAADPNVHGPLVRGYKVDAEPPFDPLDGAGALLKCFLKGESLNETRRSATNCGHATLLSGSPPADEKHLERSGRPKHVSIKLGWSTPF